MADEEQHEKRRIRFDGTVNAGHILTTVSLIGAVVIWGVRLEGRVDHESDIRGRIEKRIEEVEARSADGATKLEASLRRIEEKIDRVIYDGRGRP